MVDLSFGEFRALVAKAFRGAGYPWGLTEDAAFAAVTLAEFGLDAGVIVASLLHGAGGTEVGDRMPDASWTARGGVLCPICVGTAIADVGSCEDLDLDEVAQPALIAPFLVEISNTPDDWFVVSWAEGQCLVGNDAVVLEGSLPTEPRPVTISGTHARPTTVGRASRVTLDDTTFASLEAFSHRTYAPATSTSRLGGAGAGLVDND